MATLNVSLPDQLRSWVGEQVAEGRYSSASDYLRDLIRTDQRVQQQHWQWLQSHLQPLMDTPESEFVTTSADDVKTRMHRKIKASL